MNDSNHHSPIKAYCTVDPSQLVETGDGVLCKQCRKRLHDTSVSGGSGCGFVRAVGLSALATTIALSACKPEERIPVGEMALPSGHHPRAQYVAGSTDRVISPHTGKEVDVTGLPPGSLVIDPGFPAEEKKYFRLPESPEPSQP